MKVDREMLVIGSGGFAKEVAQLVRQLDPDGSRWASISYVSDSTEDLGKELPYGVVRYVDDELAEAIKNDVDAVLAIGDPAVKKLVYKRLSKIEHIQFPNLIHQSADWDEDYIDIGIGNIFVQGARLTCDISFGDFNMVNGLCTIGHDVKIGSFNVVNPSTNISGGVEIADGCTIGTGVQLLPGIDICSDAIIGAGAVVTKSITEVGVYAGMPARKM